MGSEVSCKGGSFSGDRVSRTLRVRDFHSDSSRSIRPSSATGFDVNCSGGSFSGCSSERTFSASDCHTDLLSSAGGRRLISSTLRLFASCSSGSVVCSAIFEFELPIVQSELLVQSPLRDVRVQTDI